MDFSHYAQVPEQTQQELVGAFRNSSGPETVPITEAELRVFEWYFGDVLDEIFGPGT